MIALAEGLHPITVPYFQRSRDKELDIGATLMSSGERLDVGNRLFHQP
jgi:hypothetical protein